jgi:hypothetical protein
MKMLILMRFGMKYFFNFLVMNVQWTIAIFDLIFDHTLYSSLHFSPTSSMSSSHCIIAAPSNLLCSIELYNKLHFVK